MQRFVRKATAVDAVQWNGSNIDEVKQLFPSVTEGYLRDRGVQRGDYLFTSTDHGLIALLPEAEFLSKYELAQESRL